MKNTFFAGCTVFGLLACPSFSVAQVPQDLLTCSTIEDSTERLSCYDDAVAARQSLAPVPEATASGGEVQQVASLATSAAPARSEEQTPPTEVDANRRLLPDWFPRISRSNNESSDPVEEPDFYETKVTRIVKNNIGRHFFYTEEGFVWRQTQVREIRAPRSLPTEAVIRQGALGSTRLELVTTGRSYLVRRVE